MPWRLLPLHSVEETPTTLPVKGTATVGRRPHNSVVCRDLAVSGQHCILHCSGGAVTQAPEVEDCSTNGTYVNETKLTKGQRQRLCDGDLLSLTKPLEEEACQDAQLRVQFRVEFQATISIESAVLDLSLPHRTMSLPRTTSGAINIVSNSGQSHEKTSERCNNAATPLEPSVGTRGGADNFAQDLLVQEQQTKAKITGELLVAQRKLEEERQSAEALSHELRKVRQQAEEERKQRLDAEEGRDRLCVEAEQLQIERRQLQELRSTHEELRQRHDTAQAELQTRLQGCTQLDIVLEQQRHEMERVAEVHRRASQQHAEASTRARQVQERCDRLEQQLSETRREANYVLEEGNRLEQELEKERRDRAQLEDEVSSIKEQVSAAELAEKAARENLDAATTRRAELECRASAAQSDAEGAKAAVRQANQRFMGSRHFGERLREVGRNLGTEFRRRADAWERGLADGCFDGLGDLCRNNVPTFAQGTYCVEEDPSTKSQDEDDDDCRKTAAAASSTVVAATAASADAANKSGVIAGQGAIGLGEMEVLSDAENSAAELPDKGPVQTDAQKQDAELAPTAVGADECDSPQAMVDRNQEEASDDDLLKPVSRDPPAKARSPLGGVTGTAGCSTAWSLEVLELGDAPAPKRLKGPAC